jgi:DME family drug/metabolite transporter
MAGTASALVPLDATPAVVGFLRLSIGAATLIVLAPAFGARLQDLPRLVMRPGVWVMGLSAGTYQALFFAAVERSGVAAAALVTVGCIPAAAGIVGWIVFRERPNWVWFVATTIAIAGLTLRSASDLHTADASGLWLALAAGSGIGAYLNAAKVEIRRGENALLLPGTAYLLGSLCLFPVIRADLVAVRWTPTSIGVALFLGVITMGLANAFQILGLHGIAPGVAATMMLADPVTATTLGVLTLHEALTPAAAGGLGLVVVGLLMQSLSPGGEQQTRGRHRT